MVNPTDFLTIAIEVSVVTLGFTAVASSMSEVPKVMKAVRIRVIYEEAMVAFAIAAITLLLMYTPLESSTTWSVSGLIYCLTRPFAAMRINSDRKSLGETISPLQVILVLCFIAAAVALQIANLWIGAFWPLASAILLSLVLALGAFVEFFRTSPFPGADQ